MAELQSIARPYAKAAFQYADASGELSQWQNQLHNLSLLVSNSDVQALLVNPKVSSEQIATLFNDILKDSLDDAGKNFVSILGERSRLSALPNIHSQFEALLEEKQQTVRAKVFVANELTQEQSQKIKAALESRLKQVVELDTIIDPSIFGGVRVEAKDLVIDGSIKGRLRHLFENLNA